MQSPGSRHRHARACAQGDEQLTDWLAAFRSIQSAEAWKAHGDWIEKNSPDFGPGIRERFDAASKVTVEDVTAGKGVRARCVARPVSAGWRAQHSSGTSPIVP